MRITADTLVKILDAEGQPCHGGSGRWHLPQNGKPGKWMPKITGIKPCERGYHVCSVQQSLSWLHESMWLVEVRGERIDHENKSVVSQARLVARVETWNERTARLLAADYAERVLPLFDAAGMTAWAAAGDAARAARDAAWAAGNAAWVAAGNAECQWQVERLVEYLNGEAGGWSGGDEKEATAAASR